jgi:hypothetical protein
VVDQVNCPHTKGAWEWIKDMSDDTDQSCGPLDAVVHTQEPNQDNCQKAHALWDYMETYGVDNQGQMTYAATWNDPGCDPLGTPYTANATLNCPHTKGASKYLGIIADTQDVDCSSPYDATGQPKTDCARAVALHNYFNMYKVDKNGVRFTYNNDAACPGLDSQTLIVPTGTHCPHTVGLSEYIGTKIDPQGGTCPALNDTLDVAAVDQTCARTIAV